VQFLKVFTKKTNFLLLREILRMKSRLYYSHKNAEVSYLRLLPVKLLIENRVDSLRTFVCELAEVQFAPTKHFAFADYICAKKNRRLSYLGLSHVLVALFIPPPQLREHSPKRPHSPQLPSTGTRSLFSGTHLPCWHHCGQGLGVRHQAGIRETQTFTRLLWFKNRPKTSASQTLEALL